MKQNLIYQALIKMLLEHKNAFDNNWKTVRSEWVWKNLKVNDKPFLQKWGLVALIETEEEVLEFKIVLQSVANGEYEMEVIEEFEKQYINLLKETEKI